MEIIQEIDLDQDSEKEETKNEKESDKLSHRQATTDLESYLASSLQSMHCLNDWVSPYLEISKPPPEKVQFSA